MTFHLFCRLASLIRLFVLTGLHEFSSPLVSIRSSLSSAKDTVYEIIDGLRWSDEDRASGSPISVPAGRPVHIIWVYLRLKWSLFLLMATTGALFSPQTKAGVCQWWSGEPLETYEDLHILKGMSCLPPTGRSSDSLFDQ